MRFSLIFLCIFLLLGCQNTSKNATIFSVIPHHNLANSSIDAFYQKIAKKYPNIKNIILISPNHFGNEDMISFPENGKFCYHNSCIDGVLLPITPNKDNKIFIKNNEYWTTNEHGIGNHFAFIGTYFPTAKTSALILKIRTNFSIENQEITKQLESYTFSGDTLFVASVDASHHTHEKIALLHDTKTLNFLQGNTEQEKIEVDCPNCLFVLKSLAKSKNKKFFELINRSSVDTITQKNTNYENTSHLYGFFRKHQPKTLPNLLDTFEKMSISYLGKGKSFIFVPQTIDAQSLVCFYSHKDTKRKPEFWHNRWLYSLDIAIGTRSEEVLQELFARLGFTDDNFFEREDISLPEKPSAITLGYTSGGILFYDFLSYQTTKSGAIDCESFGK